jgi:uncharacterized protein YifN (PemK superfamily)
MCDFHGYIRPEIIKIRPVIVLQRHPINSKLVTVVPLSTTAPQKIQRFQHQLLVNPLPDKQHITCWAKCDLTATVSLARLDRYRLSKNQYVVPTISEPEFLQIKKGVAFAFKFAHNLAVPERGL